MKRAMLAVAVAAILMHAGAANVCAQVAKESKVHLIGAAVASSLVLTDGAGFRWDITTNGMVNDGTNDAYDGGMQLNVNGSAFYWSAQSKLSTDKREIEMGPWNNGQVNVSRRIYIDPKVGYCRWIDIFENNTSSNVTLTLQYYSNTGGSVQQVYTSGGKTEVAESDWAVITANAEGASNPALTHVFSSRGSKLKIKYTCRMNDDNMYYNFPLEVPAGKSAAICMFESQSKNMTEAKKFLDGFSPQREMAKIPTDLRKLIANMGGAPTMDLGGMDLPRNDTDTAILRNDEAYYGTILTERFVIETFYGKLDLPGSKVIGLGVPDADDPNVLLQLVDGQIVAGKLTNAPLKFKLSTGSEMSLPVSKIKSISYRQSEDKPDKPAIKSMVVSLRTNQRLFFKPPEGDTWAFQTEYGDLNLRSQDLVSLMLDTPDGGLHRAVFRNNSVLSGLLKADKFKLALELGPTLEVPAHLVDKFMFPQTPDTDGPYADLRMRNDDQLIGRITDKQLVVSSKLGDNTLTPSQISEMTFSPETLGQVQVKQFDGTVASGKLTTKTIHFRIGKDGPELPLYIGHITSIVCPKGSHPTTNPSTNPADDDKTPTVVPDGGELKSGGNTITSPSAASSVDESPEVKKVQAAIDETAKRLADLQNAGKEEEAAAMAAKLAELRKMLELMRAEAAKKNAEMIKRSSEAIDQKAAEIQNLQKNMAVLKQALDLVQKQGQADKAAVLQAELAKLQAQIVELQKALQDEQAKAVELARAAKGLVEEKAVDKEARAARDAKDKEAAAAADVKKAKAAAAEEKAIAEKKAAEDATKANEEAVRALQQQQEQDVSDGQTLITGDSVTITITN